MRYILAATEDRAATEVIRAAFHRPFQVDAAATVQDCREFLRKRRYEFTFIDLDLLGGLGVARGDSGAALRGVRQAFPSIDIIVMTPPERAGEAVDAVKAGAANYVTYPLNADEIRYVTESLHEGIRAQSELDYLRDRFWQSDSLDVVQTRNPVMRTVFDQIRLVAPTKSTVLLAGETGTGKGVLAKLIHRHSNRRGVQFIGIHCGAIPDTLLESELFGHEKGAFTGSCENSNSPTAGPSSSTKSAQSPLPRRSSSSRSSRTGPFSGSGGRPSSRRTHGSLPPPTWISGRWWKRASSGTTCTIA